MSSKISDPSLAEKGELSYNWAYKHMPTLSKIISREEPKKPLSGRKISVCLHVTKETSVLIMGLINLGAEVNLAGANPLSTQDDIAAFLDSKGVNVFAWRGQTTNEYNECINDIIANPEIIMDDGSDAHVAFHLKNNDSPHVLGGTEETTTGVIRIKALEKHGNLKYPVIAVNNAYTKHLFDNRYGTGQSTMDGILRATSLLMAGKTVVVSGYGWVGRGIALRARGLGSHVTVTEVDALRALEAHMDGFDVKPISEAAKTGDILITATGQTRVIRGEHIEEMKNGAILVNAGHFDAEIDVKYLECNHVSNQLVRPNTEEYALKNGKHVYLIGEGRIANLVAAEGHPPDVMMMSFSNQLLSAIYISDNQNKLETKVFNVPPEIDQDVSQSTLDAIGISIDEPTEEQKKYVDSWEL